MEGSIGEDTICRRRLCGEGEFDVPGFIAALDRAGYDGPYGVEILSEEFRKLPLDEACRRSFDTSVAQFAFADSRN
jgi:sugar phosphate isomerase/epimerase